MEEVETSFGLHPLVPEEGIGMWGDIVMLEGIWVPGNIGALGDNVVPEQRLAAGESRPLRVDEEKGGHSLKEAQDCFPHWRCEGEP